MLEVIWTMVEVRVCIGLIWPVNRSKLAWKHNCVVYDVILSKCIY